MKTDPFYVQSEHVRGERRQYWVEDSRTELRYRRPVTNLTSNKSTAEKQSDRLNKEITDKQSQNKTQYRRKSLKK